MRRYRSFPKSLALQIAGLMFLLMAIGGIAAAQTGTSTIRGAVTDAQGQVVAGATVTIKNEETNFVRTTTTDSTGGYIFTVIPPKCLHDDGRGAGLQKIGLDGRKNPG